MITQWNDQEDDALQGLPLRTQVMYLRGLRRYMNFQTGIVGGPERRISLKMLGELCHEEINRQLQEMPTKNAIRASIEQLKRAGLIERIPDEDYLIFFLKKADKSKSVQNNNDTTTTQQPHTHSNTVKTSNDKAFGVDSDTTTTQPQHSNNHTHQYTGNQDTTVLTILTREENFGSLQQNNSSGAMFWAEYFVNNHGFLIHEAQTAKTIPMFSSWVDRGVQIADVEMAIAAGNAWLMRNGQTGPPNNPILYGKFLETILATKKGTKNETGGKNTEHSGRKISHAERSSASVRTAEEIDRRSAFRSQGNGEDMAANGCHVFLPVDSKHG